MAVAAGVGFGGDVVASLLEGNDVHVAVVVDVAGNERGRVGHLKGGLGRDLRPFVGRRGKECKVGHALACLFVCGGVLNAIADTSGHDVLVSVVVQIYGGRSAVVKTPRLRDQLGVVGC